MIKRLFKKKHITPSVELPSQQVISEILENIRAHHSYYAGGTLCVDKVVPDDVLMLNLNGECFLMSNGQKNVLNFCNRTRLFNIYKEVKGETDYYKTQFNNF